MTTTFLELDLPQPFDFKSLLQAHGWVDLQPNQYLAEENSFSRIEELSSAKVVELVISAPDERVQVAIRHASRLSAGDLREVENRTRHMLRLDEDFTEFYRLCRRMGKPWSAMASGRGRLLRSPGLFEDIVKVICTTNIQWGGTRRMVAEIVHAFGSPHPLDPELKAFPKPEAIATLAFEDFRNQTRLGYRAPFIHQLAVDFCAGGDAFEKLRDAGRSTPEIRKELLAIKGIGSYAAASVLMLLGRYDEIPVDSVFQQLMRAKYFKENDFDLKKALAIYQAWGQWKYLAYWFDLLDYYQ